LGDIFYSCKHHITQSGIIEEAQLLMGQHFPFKKKPTPTQQQLPPPPPVMTGFNSNQYFPKSATSSDSTQPKVNLPPTSNSGYGDPTYNVPKKYTPEQ
jgi:hypothetical protein